MNAEESKYTFMPWRQNKTMRQLMDRPGTCHRSDFWERHREIKNRTNPRKFCYYLFCNLPRSYFIPETKLLGFSPQANCTDRATAASRRCIVSTFADRGCHVVSATDPRGRYLGFLDPEPLLFHSSSSSVILTRLSGLRSRSIISHKIW
jgi:hypothetical protein